MALTPVDTGGVAAEPHIAARQETSMTRTLIQQLADFTVGTTFDSLPNLVAQECKRTLLDSIGCAVAALDEHKGRAGIEYGRSVGATDPKATVMGTGERFSVLGASFANAELVSALDMDAVLPPGHVTPYVLPAALSMAESIGASGKSFIAAMAAAHEMSNRFGKAMDNQRRTKDGKVDPPKVFGYSSTIFGAAAAIAVIRGQSADTMAHSLGIAGSIAPVNSQIAWFEHLPISTIKYLNAGMLAQQALTAVALGELGHRGDLLVLDDRDYGWARFIGTEKWAPEELITGLGSVWNFPGATTYKPYAHCRIMHGMFDCIVKVVQEHQLKPDEIEAMKVYVEGIAERPCWLNRKIDRVEDAQFSMAHGIAMAAHCFPQGKAWQDPKNVFSPSVMSLMDRVTTQVHPDYASAMGSNAAARPSRVEIRARGQTFVEEKLYPKGSPSPDPTSRMSDEELAAKFRHNCEGVLPTAHVDAVVENVFSLEKVADIGVVMKLCGPGRAQAPARSRAELAAAK
jgi:2-methylcitrate dehydratase PrpD